MGVVGGGLGLLSRRLLLLVEGMGGEEGEGVEGEGGLRFAVCHERHRRESGGHPDETSGGVREK